MWKLNWEYTKRTRLTPGHSQPKGVQLGHRQLKEGGGRAKEAKTYVNESHMQHSETRMSYSILIISHLTYIPIHIGYTKKNIYFRYMAKGNHRERKETKKPKKIVVKTV